MTTVQILTESMALSVVLFPVTFFFWRWLDTPRDCNQLQKNGADHE
jgi:hypothetical protein